jgi:hypothetical protein
MRRRVSHADPIVAAYHRAVLLVEALPAWAQVRRRWFFGGKTMLREMEREDPARAAAYAAAASPSADAAAFRRLLDAVFDARLPRPPRAGPIDA